MLVLVVEDIIMPTINLGSAIGLAFENLKQYAVPSLGLNLRYNKLAKAWDWGFGSSLNAKALSLGVTSPRHHAHFSPGAQGDGIFPLKDAQ